MAGKMPELFGSKIYKKKPLRGEEVDWFIFCVVLRLGHLLRCHLGRLF
jgi:hypothetical protein